MCVCGGAGGGGGGVCLQLVTSDYSKSTRGYGCICESKGCVNVMSHTDCLILHNCMHCDHTFVICFHVQAVNVITQNGMSNIFLNSEDKILRHLHTYMQITRVDKPVETNLYGMRCTTKVHHSLHTVLSHYQML